MSTNNCNHDQPCGCNNDELTTLPDPCDTTECVGEECDQIINCDCVRYDGVPIPEINAEPGDSLCSILTGLVDLIVDAGGVPGSQGERGDEGIEGPQGPIGLTGPQGPAGPIGPIGLKGDQGDQGEVGPQGEQGVRGRAGLAYFPAEVDSGWVDLNGFDHYNTSVSGVEKPQVRRIGRNLYFKGFVVIPLSSNTGSARINITTGDSASKNKYYEDERFTQVYTGSGGCTVDANNGDLQFNLGSSVIPSSLTSGLPARDSSFTRRNVLINRRVRNAANSTVSVNLTSVVSIFLSSSGILTVQAQQDIEQNNPANTRGLGSNLSRLLVTKTTAGDYLHDLRTTNIFTQGNGPGDLGTNTLEVNVEADDPVSPISIDAGQIEQLGGFEFQLDGFMLTLPKVGNATISGSPTLVSKTSTTITVNAQSISGYGNGTPFQKGVCWAESPITPSVNEDYVLSTATGTSIGNLTATGLQPSTTYTFRGFVVTESGIHYSASSATITTNA